MRRLDLVKVDHIHTRMKHQTLPPVAGTLIANGSVPIFLSDFDNQWNKFALEIADKELRGHFHDSPLVEYNPKRSCDVKSEVSPASATQPSNED